MNGSARRKVSGVAVGVDGCPGGWLAVTEAPDGSLTAQVVASFSELVRRFPSTAVFGVDIPIGLPEEGARQCEQDARRLLGRPRMSSVFSAPLRACLVAMKYEEACGIRFQIEVKRMSRQAFGILPKIREVDDVLAADGSLAPRVIEVHPEVSFLLMNDGSAMRDRKKSRAGKAERRALLLSQWPESIEGMRASLRGQDYALDDLHDAMAALWSARRWVAGIARVLGDPVAWDRTGLPMRIVG
jgi:predicted RNase H-like nuclease